MAGWSEARAPYAIRTWVRTWVVGTEQIQLYVTAEAHRKVAYFDHRGELLWSPTGSVEIPLDLLPRDEGKRYIAHDKVS